MVACVATGCTSGESKADPRPPITTGSPSPSPSPTAQYGVKGFNLCAAVNREHLGDLAATTDKEEPSSADSLTFEQVECTFRMHSANDENVLLVVSARTHSSTEDAATSFTEGRDSDANAKMRDDGDVSGVGDEAYGKSQDRHYGLSKNLLLARAGNLVVYVFISVQSEETTPRSTLARLTAAVANDLIDKAPRR